MIIYGKQVCLYALTRHSKEIEKIYIAKKGVLPKELFERFGSKIKFIENRWAQNLARGGNHQGILIEIKDIALAELEDIKTGEFIVIFDGITDAGNIGAIVRTSYALGVDGIVATGVNRLNLSTIARTSSGALLDMPLVIRYNILDILNELKQSGFYLYGASMEGEPIENKLFAKKRVLILGSEDLGLSKKVKSRLDETISIKMKREFDSLNVSVAAGIMIHRMSYGVK